MNGGTCKSTAPDRYTCTCPEGFGGANCDVVLNPCATEPCANGGKCRTVDAVAATSAGVGVSGAAALGFAAQSPPLLVPKQFHCDCRPGWTGSTCNTGMCTIKLCVTYQYHVTKHYSTMDIDWLNLKHASANNYSTSSNHI